MKSTAEATTPITSLSIFGSVLFAMNVPMERAVCHDDVGTPFPTRARNPGRFRIIAEVPSAHNDPSVKHATTATSMKWFTTFIISFDFVVALREVTE